MYGQLISFIVALLLFNLQEPGGAELRPAAQSVQTVASTAVVFCVFVLICYLAFKPLRQSLRQPYPDGTATIRYHRLLSRLSIIGLAALAIEVYGFGLKDLFRVVPGFDKSFTLSGIVGLSIYFLHLSVVWFWAHPIYRSLFGTQLSRLQFIKWQLSFHSGLLLPWLLIALVSDGLENLALAAMPHSEVGQIFLFGAVLALFLALAPGLVVRLWGCEPLPAGPIRTDLDAFCRLHHFRIGNFLLWPLFGGDLLTAAVMGILPRLRYILVTRGLIELLSPDELKAVVAHEMGHVRRYHAIFYLVLFLCYALLAHAYLDPLLLFLLKNPTVLGWAMAAQSRHQTLYSLVNSAPIIVAMVLYFRYLFGYFLRNSERQADLFALSLIGHPFTLISSLRKIAVHSGHIEDLPSWHHFSIRERIECLSRCHDDPTLIHRHQVKLYGSALIFLVVFSLLTAAGLRLQSSQMVRDWRVELQVHLLENELNLEPGNPDLYASYGGLLLEHKRYAEAQTILKQALKLNPEHVGVLNNLAWLYATSPEPYWRPQLALTLAIKAATRLPDPHILDTLAEAYFVNGALEKALLTIRHAIAKKPDKMAYYLEQEQKFLAAINRRREETVQ